MKNILIVFTIVTVSTGAYAIDAFTPLTAPATSSNTNETTNPFLLPAGWIATKVTDDLTLSGQAGYQSSFGRWDMIDIGGINNEFIYIPMEVAPGAGVVRYNRDTATSVTLMGGNGTANFSNNPNTWDATDDDYGSFDPAVITPTNTLLVAEEGSARGRMFEISNPGTATGTADTNVSWLSNIPSVAHEGVKFDSQGRMYFIDENNSGSLYRMTPNIAGNLSSGKVEAMKVNSYAGLASADGIGQAGRTGAGVWVAIVDAGGNVLTTANPYNFGISNRGGRAAADEVGATPYGRPEDLEITTLANGNQAIFMATTSEGIVWCIELNADGNEGVNVTEFVNSMATPSSVSNPVGDGGGDSQDTVYGLDDPDNLAIEIGSNGEIQLFIIEDEDPSDIWVATDADGNGIAETVDLFASLGPFGSEATGFIADPRGGYLVNIQHPSSGNDALWSITQSQVDTDSDGVVDSQDAFPTDPDEWSDTDADGIGDNADLDDDNDGLSDLLEISYGTDPLDPESYPIIADGDIAPFGNPDGVINAADVLIASQLVLGLRVPGSLQYAHGEMNGDGVIGVADLILIQKIIIQN